MPVTRIASSLLPSLASALLAFGVVACDDKKEDKPSEDKPAAEKTDDAKKPSDAVAAKPADAKTEQPADAKAAVPTDAAKPAEAVAAAPPADPGAAGAAYFIVQDRGIVHLDGGAFTVVESSPTILAREMQVHADGNLYVLGPDGVMKLTGTKAEMFVETSYQTTGSVDAFAVGKDGKTVWAVGYNGISTWDGAAWKSEEKSVLGADVTLIKGVVVDAKDRVWVASSNAIHTREADKWVVVDTSKAVEREPYFDVMRRSPDGVAYALASSKLVKLEAPTAVSAVALQIDSFASLGNLSFASNGTMGLRSNYDEVMAVSGTTTQKWKAGTDFPKGYIRAVGVDGQGRVWVATDIGISILGPGDAKTEWRSGSVIELAGQIDQIVALGAGPALPTVGPVKTGALTGKIIQAGKGLATTDVELCPSPDMMFEKSPCNDSPVKFAGKTDADGVFTFDGVPIGAYGVSVKVGDKWQLTFTSNFGTKMKEGEKYDIGSIEIRSE